PKSKKYNFERCHYYPGARGNPRGGEAARSEARRLFLTITRIQSNLKRNFFRADFLIIDGWGWWKYSDYGDGVDGAPNGISVPRWSLSPTHLKGSRPWASLSGISPLSRGSGSIWRRT